MDILIITENFYPERNAPSKRLYDHAIEWIKLGHKITILTGVPNAPKGKVFKGYKNKIYQSENVNGIDVKRVWTYIAKNEGFLFRSLDFISFMISSLFAGLFLKKFDRIVVSSPQFLPVISGFIIAKIKSIPFVLEIRDLWPDSIVAVGSINKESPIIKILDRIAKYIYKKSDLIVVVTNSFKSHLISIGIDKHKIIVITNGFNFQKTLIPNRNIEDIHKKYNISSKKTVVSYIGTIGMSHGIEIILEAANTLKNTIFLIIGEGSEKKSLQIIAKNKKIKNVKFIDSISWQEIVNINQVIDYNLIHLRKLDLFETVIPSKIFESMALKKPIIAGLIGESLDIINESQSGISIQPENSQSLVNGINYLENNPKKSEQITANGFTLVSEKYNRKNLANKMIKNIEKI